MKKLMIAPKNKNMILKTIDKVDAYLLGVEDFSVNLPVSFSLKERNSSYSKKRKQRDFFKFK